jgi:DNA (cytosine-5)-methyltransferase 1
MYLPTAKGYFSGCGGMEIGIIQAGVKIIQSLDLDPCHALHGKEHPLFFSCYFESRHQRQNSFRAAQN